MKTDMTDLYFQSINYKLYGKNSTHLQRICKVIFIFFKRCNGSKNVAKHNKICKDTFDSMYNGKGSRETRD